MPFVYEIYLWRKRMKVSYLEAISTPLKVIRQDFDIMQIENDIRAKEQSKETQKR